jgi:hypothetical protein
MISYNPFSFADLYRACKMVWKDMAVADSRYCPDLLWRESDKLPNLAVGIASLCVEIQARDV